MTSKNVNQHAARVDIPPSPPSFDADRQQLRLISAPAELTTPAHELPAERELIIDVRRDDWVQYEGTAAQLIAEGVIPEGFEWPRAAADKRWDANGLDYWFRRTRPEGHKGPMKSWLEVDNWVIRIQVTGRDVHWCNRRAIERKAEELRDEIYRQSPAGRHAWNASCGAYWKAHEDKAFQAFKSILVPERKRPGRKPKGAPDSSSQGGCHV